MKTTAKKTAKTAPEKAAGETPEVKAAVVEPNAVKRGGLCTPSMACRGLKS